MNRNDETESRERIPEGEKGSGLPGDGAGRKDEVSGSGVYPASAGNAPADAEIRTPAEWGQGDRGAAGAEDSGESELFYYEAELRAAGIEPSKEQEEEEADVEERPGEDDRE